MNKKLLGVLGVAALLLAGNFAWQEVKEVDAAESATVTQLNTLISKYYNNGVYTKNTSINVTEAARNEITENGGFHNSANSLIRTTYFDGNELWMTNDSGVNSGYGTDENGNMTHFKKVDGENKVDYTVAMENGGGMEEFYITLKDVVATDEQSWTLTDGVYLSSNENVVEWFKAICAPCYVGFETATNNYITLAKVSIQEAEGALQLKLYASEGDKAKLTDNNLVFAQANIYSSLFDVVVNDVVYPLNTNNEAELIENQTGEYYVEGIEVLKDHSVKARKMGTDIQNIGADGSGQNVAGYNTTMSIINDANSSFYLKTWADGGHSLAVTGYVEPEVKETIKIYYYNTNKWSTVNCYAFGVTGLEPNGAWPGDKMTSVAGKTNWYSIDYSAGSLSGLTIIFNNGSGTQTGNLTVDMSKLYYNGATETAYSSFEAAEQATVSKPICYIRGAMNNWSDTATWQFSYDSNDANQYIFTGNFTAGQEFKVYCGGWYGIGSVESGCKNLVSGSDNIKMNSSGKYTIYWKTGSKTMWIAKN